MSDLVQTIVGSLVSSTVVIAAAGFIFKESFKRFLDKEMERFKYELGVDAKTRELALKSQIEFKERQLAEFYGPIYALLKRGRPIYEFWSEDRLEEVDSAIRKLFVTANNNIVEIILTKSHLIDGDAIPDSFLGFLSHVALWHAYLDTPHKGIPFDEKKFPAAFFPETFEQQIIATTERLKKELYDLHSRYGLITTTRK